METIIVKAYRVLVHENDGTLVPTNIGRPWSQVSKMISDVLTQMMIESIDIVPVCISSILSYTGGFDDLGVIEDVTDKLNMVYTTNELIESNYNKWSMGNHQVVTTYGLSVKMATDLNDVPPSVNIVIIFKHMVGPTPTSFSWYMPVRCYAFATEFFNRDDKNLTLSYNSDVYDFLNAANNVNRKIKLIAHYI